MSLTAYSGHPLTGMTYKIPQTGENACPLPAANTPGESLAALAGGGQGEGTSLADFAAWLRSEHLRQAATVSAGVHSGQVDDYCGAVQRLTSLHGALMLLQEFGK